MANRRAAVKRMRVDAKRHSRNQKIRRELKKSIKQYLGLLTVKNAAEAKTLFTKVTSLLDKAAKKRVIHPNTANRNKSRLAKRLLKAA
ncbi:MAG: 30S ribosomal protein S20 [Candidatus Omnitrophica bacterium]|nr:30S ribosomal protein S20 [Candidatus Omnitrophota bacterium]MDD4940329.1 30S ribosomal protein S20 [Candidatus Omnitrophota bacterium]MDD5775816.1 30S ribosomal protein S20 [Candidatus Omnitrophota bacterium]HNQ50010.1 30S ribosomal protein S20 [Candidatus Omnitrophota bacterium]HQO37762.1 30S ribosomal protein S20 [Candidatus Omnitrophota bacterium]